MAHVIVVRGASTSAANMVEGLSQPGELHEELSYPIPQPGEIQEEFHFAILALEVVAYTLTVIAEVLAPTQINRYSHGFRCKGKLYCCSG